MRSYHIIRLGIKVWDVQTDKTGEFEHETHIKTAIRDLGRDIFETVSLKPEFWLLPFYYYRPKRFSMSYLISSHYKSAWFTIAYDKQA